MTAMTVLYHYTCVEHLPSILANGLRATESNISPRNPHAGPDVVWLTTNADATSGLGLQHSATDKFAIRIAVEVPKRRVHRWREWAESRGADHRWLDILAESGGWRSWRVHLGPIPTTQFVEVLDRRVPANA